MEKNYGFVLPKAMQPEFARIVQAKSDEVVRELGNDEIFELFKKTYLENDTNIKLIDFTTEISASEKEVSCTLRYLCDGVEIESIGKGNGPIDACKNALNKECHYDFVIKSYSEHSLSEKSSANAVAYIEIERSDYSRYFGVGVDSDITIASIKALFSALNRAFGE